VRYVLTLWVGRAKVPEIRKAYATEAKAEEAAAFLLQAFGQQARYEIAAEPGEVGPPTLGISEQAGARLNPYHPLVQEHPLFRNRKARK
jgi:hypothetical protein